MTDERALVLGGGGLTGAGWLVGVIAGLADIGIDLSNNDLVVGTSCGAIVGAHLAHDTDPTELYDHVVATASRGPARLLTSQAMAELGSLISGGQNLQLARARVGRTALAAEPLAGAAELRAGVEALCPFQTWPDRKLLLSTVDADNGEFVTLEKAAGVSLRDAVIASCALPFVYPPAQVANRRWVDGFIRSPANVDLAEKCKRIVVLAPMAEGFSPIGNVPDQVREVRERTGAAVAMVVADETVAAVNVNPMDPAHLPAVARAGRRQAASVADLIAEVW